MGDDRSSPMAKWHLLRSLKRGYTPKGEWSEGREASRSAFLRGSNLPPPYFLRVIDCKRSVAEGKVVLIPWDVESSSPLHDHDHEQDELAGYSAISHTYGQDVYGVFDCSCAAQDLVREELPPLVYRRKTPCSVQKELPPRADPLKTPCPGHHNDMDPCLHQRVIKDILTMCQHLVVAGALYAWHDGVCIAQHDHREVNYFIWHIGWIYASAKEAIIFPHYIGRPMAPIGPGGPHPLISRWQTRVWTFQEAVLSKCRRYCVRIGEALFLEDNFCCDRLEFEQRLASWYDPEHSTIAIVIESQLQEVISDLYFAIRLIKASEEVWENGKIWTDCLEAWSNVLSFSCFSFPTLADAIESCNSRDSKHQGDRINSILALAGVQNYNAPKEGRNMEKSTMEFFERMGKQGLAFAVFAINLFVPQPSHQFTWLPSLTRPLIMTPNHFEESRPSFMIDSIEFEVLDAVAGRGGGEIKLTGLLTCVHVQFHVLLEPNMLVPNEVVNCNGGEKFLNVALCHDVSNYNPAIYEATLVGADPDVVLGDALLPSVDDPGSTSDPHYTASSHGYISGKNIGSSLNITKIWLPTVECAIQAVAPAASVVTFVASLIFPVDVLKKKYESPFPIVIVQGLIHPNTRKICVGNVAKKIGCFVANKNLHEIVQQHRCTTLADLIII